VKVGDVVTRIVDSNKASLDWSRTPGVIVEVSPALYRNEEAFYRVMWQENTLRSSWYKDFQIEVISCA
jgi:hypothetical protein